MNLNGLTADARRQLKEICAQAVDDVILCMRKNKIPIPSIYQKSTVARDLPISLNEREAEIERRLRYIEPTTTRINDMTKTLYNLLAYAEEVKQLNSRPLADIIIEKVDRWQTQFLNPPGGIAQPIPPLPPLSPTEERERRARQIAASIRFRSARHNIARTYENKGLPRSAAVSSSQAYRFSNARSLILPPQTIPPPDPQTAARVDLNEVHSQHLEKHALMGAIKKRLFEMPDYERDRGGPKFPPHALTITNDLPQSSYSSIQQRRELEALQQDLGQLATRRMIMDLSSSDDN